MGGLHDIIGWNVLVGLGGDIHSAGWFLSLLSLFLSYFSHAAFWNCFILYIFVAYISFYIVRILWTAKKYKQQQKACVVLFFPV